MPLSKETTDQIRKEAEAYLDKQGTSYPVDATYNRMIKDQIRSSYETGATAWAVWKEKAEGYEKALKEISQESNSQLQRNIALKALDI